MRDQLNAHHQAMSQTHSTGPSPQAIDHLHHQRKKGIILLNTLYCSQKKYFSNYSSKLIPFTVWQLLTRQLTVAWKCLN